jgi:hypothetical protein
MTRAHPYLRRLGGILACAAAIGCSGEPTQPQAGLTLTLAQPTLAGRWEPDIYGYLVCRFPVQVASTGSGTLVLTGATYTLVAAYGSYERTWTSDDLARFLGSDHVASGQTLAGTIPIAGAASFHGTITLQYAASAESPIATTSASYACNAP